MPPSNVCTMYVPRAVRYFYEYYLSLINHLRANTVPTALPSSEYYLLLLPVVTLLSSSHLTEI